MRVDGQTQAVRIARNEIRETRGAAERIGVRMDPETKDIQLAGNTIEGFAQAVVDLRKT